MKSTHDKGSAVIRIPRIMDEQLTVLSNHTGHSKTFYLKEAVSRYLEDMEDHVLSQAALEKTKKRSSYDELAKKLGLER